jgi:hypothetical protein
LLEIQRRSVRRSLLIDNAISARSSRRVPTRFEPPPSILMKSTALPIQRPNRFAVTSTPILPIMSHATSAKAICIQTPRASPPTAATAHQLPCRVHHDGTLALPAHLWQPAAGSTAKEQGEGKFYSFPLRAVLSGSCFADWRGVLDADSSSGAPVVYFRGRRLLGADVRVPEGYRGAFARALGGSAVGAC